MGGADVAAGEAILNRAGIPTFPYPDTAARVVQLHVALQPTTCAACTRRRSLPRRSEQARRPRDAADAIIAAARATRAARS